MVATLNAMRYMKDLDLRDRPALGGGVSNRLMLLVREGWMVVSDERKGAAETVSGGVREDERRSLREVEQQLQHGAGPEPRCTVYRGVTGPGGAGHVAVHPGH